MKKAASEKKSIDELEEMAFKEVAHNLGNMVYGYEDVYTMDEVWFETKQEVNEEQREAYRLLLRHVAQNMLLHGLKAYSLKFKETHGRSLDEWIPEVLTEPMFSDSDSDFEELINF